MKLIRKTSSIFGNNSGETMVEVLVAFTLLSIMLVIFSEGIAWATNSESRATQRRSGADLAMKTLQHDLAAGNPGQAGNVESFGTGTITAHTYTYGEYQYTVYTGG